MKRKSIDDLFNDIDISVNNKKIKTENKNNQRNYSQSEVDNLLKLQKEFLFGEFKNYIDGIRSIVNISIPH